SYFCSPDHYDRQLLNLSECVILIGRPASGKSTIARKISSLSDYRIVNQDTIKTRAKCISVFREIVRSGHRVIVDNTSPDTASRSVFTDIALDAGYQVSYIHIDIPEEMSYWLNFIRSVVED